MADGAPALAHSWLVGLGHELRSRAGGAGGLARLGRREEPTELGRPWVEEVLTAAGCGRETETTAFGGEGDKKEMRTVKEIRMKEKRQTGK